MRLLPVIALALFAAPAIAADEASLRDAFRAAYAAAQDGDTRTDSDDPLRGYVLYPYIELARLRYRLSRTPAEADDDIADFLRTHADEPLASRLRKPWLLSLAERQRWQPYLDATPPATSDSTLRCHALVARLALKQTEGLLEDITAMWQTGQDQPDACDPAFDWLRAQGALTEDLIRQRVNLALQANQPKLARKLAERLTPGKSARALMDAALLLEDPQTEFTRQLREGLLSDARVTGAAFTKLTKRDSLLAQSLLEPLALQTTPEQRSQMLSDAAIGLALDHRVEAIPLFRALDAAASPQALEWRLRSALWAGDFEQVLVWIAQMPGPAQQEPRWRYWRGRALAATGKDTEARIAYTLAAQERGYYGFLAAERLGIPARIEHQALATNAKARDTLEKHAAFVRARELYFCELESEAASELRHVLAPLDAAGQKEAARLIAGWGWVHQTIPLLATLGVWDDVAIRYPLLYEKEVAAAAKESTIPVEQIYSVMRQESLFNPRARSSADAYGLMQMLLATARNTAAKFGLPRPATADLLVPVRNLRLGALHLKELLEDFNDQWPLALAAYNAGPRRASEWLPPLEMDADIWIENIPFNETRLYVQRILGHRVLFGWRLTGKPLTMLPLMDDIPPAMDGPVPPEAGAGRQPPSLDEPPAPFDTPAARAAQDRP
ncbi:MAG: transglycosylase SLT domain-containing protein [Pseudomonadota bacterium]